jgi:poly(A) polymerase
MPFVYSESVESNRLNIAFSQDITSVLSRLQSYVTARNIETYIVGGLVRDSVLKRDTIDIDISTAKDALSIAPEIASYLGAHSIVLDSDNGVVRLLPVNPDKTSSDAWQLDIATLQGDLNSDLRRRDFTIDALAIDLAKINFETIGAMPVDVEDPFDGLGDIQRKLVRAVTPQIFENDSVRLLRGVRLSVELGFKVEPGTELLIKQYHQLINNVAGERIREELLKLLEPGDSYQTIVYLDELGLLTSLIPELAATRDVDQPQEHTWNVFHHSARSISALDFILHRGAWEFAGPEVLNGIPWNEQISAYFDSEISPRSSIRVLTKIAALLHDIAKPQTRIINEFGKIRFYGHPQEGAPISAVILERLRFSNREIKFVEDIVRYHLRPVQMTEDGAPPTKRAIYRYYRDMGEAAYANLYFSLADHLATRGPELENENWNWHVGVVAQVITAHATAPEITQPRKLLDGNDLRKELGLQPGPRIGEILEELREAQAAGEVTTRTEALDFVKKLAGDIKTPEPGSS